MDQFVVKHRMLLRKGVHITENDRTRKYPAGTFHMEDGMLFCSSCNMVNDHVQKCVVDKHLEALKTVLNRKTVS